MSYVKGAMAPPAPGSATGQNIQHKILKYLKERENNIYIYIYNGKKVIVLSCKPWVFESRLPFVELDISSAFVNGD